MSFLMDKPGAVLLVAAVLALVLRWPVAALPAVGGLLAWVLLAAAVFFAVGGVWMLFMGRGAD
ncbi:MAG: hypothetical protein ACRBI6_09960 [Acidimicrobiales bacterium]